MEKSIKMSLATAREMYKSEFNSKSIKDWLLENFTEDELNPKELVKSWEDSFKGGVYINTNSFLLETNIITDKNEHKNIFRTKKEANAYGIVAAQLSQIVADANGDWIADWSNYNTQNKYCINYYRERLTIMTYYSTRCQFPMKSLEIAKACLDKHCDLWEQFYMIK